MQGLIRRVAKEFGDMKIREALVCIGVWGIVLIFGVRKKVPGTDITYWVL